jgi:hypothetical protein
VSWLLGRLKNLMTRTEIYVSADLLCTGIEVRSADDPERGLVVTQPADLGSSKTLTADFVLWQRWFDAVADLLGLENRFDYLGDKFDEYGRELARRLAAELGKGVRVVYSPQGGWRRQVGRGASIIVQE